MNIHVQNILTYRYVNQHTDGCQFCVSWIIPMNHLHIWTPILFYHRHSMIASNMPIKVCDKCHILSQRLWQTSALHWWFAMLATGSLHAVLCPCQSKKVYWKHFHFQVLPISYDFQIHFYHHSKIEENLCGALNRTKHGKFTVSTSYHPGFSKIDELYLLFAETLCCWVPETFFLLFDPFATAVPNFRTKWHCRKLTVSLLLEQFLEYIPVQVCPYWIIDGLREALCKNVFTDTSSKVPNIQNVARQEIIQ